MAVTEIPSNDDEINAEDKPTSASTRKVLCVSVLKTLALFFSWTCLGLYAEVLGPSLQTYVKVTSSDTERIGTAFSLREVGMFFGSLGGALMADRFVAWRHITMAGTLLVGAGSILTVPWCKTVGALSATFFVSGAAHGAMTANGNPLLNSLWLEKPGGPFNFMHSGYGIGAALAPALLAPFTLEHHGTADNKTSEIIHLHPPYGIIAGLCLISACSFFCFRFCGTTQPSPPQDKEEGLELKDDNDGTAIDQDKDQSSSPSSTQNRLQRRCQHLFAFLIRQRFILHYLAPPVFLLYAALVGNERVFSKYLFVSANEGPAKLSKDDCFLLTGVYWIVFALARIVSVPVSVIIPVQYLFGIQLVGAFAMALGLYLATATRTVYFAFTVCFGLFKSPLFPTGLAIISTATPVTGMMTFFVNLGSSVGASILQYVAGLVLNRQGRHMFPLLVMMTGLVLVFIGAALLLMTRLYRKRFGRESTEEFQFDVDDKVV